MEPRKWRILLVEDDEDDYILTQALLAKALGERFSLVWVQDYAAALRVLANGNLDVMLVDYDLGAHTGLDLLHAAAACGCRTPAILLTGRGSYDVDVEAMRAGAADYIAKTDVTPMLLERAIRYAVERQRSQAALQQANERLAQARDELELRVEERTRELLDKDARLQMFLTQLPAVVWSTDTELHSTSSMGRGLDSAGLSSDELLGQAGDRSAGGPQDALIQAALKRALQGESVALETGRQGHIYQIYVDPFYNSEREIIGTVGIALDVTESRRMEAELAEVQRRLIDNTENERLQLSQELHDGPMQELYGLTFQFELLRYLEDPQDRSRVVDALREKQLDVIQTLRGISGELRPPTLTPFGLEKAIRSHVERFGEAQPGLEIRLDLAADGRALPERMRLALFRIYQVAMTNVVRHASASQVDVRLNLENGFVRLEVEDNGQGFEAPARWIELVRRGHFGLAGASERAEAVGGRLEVDTRPGSGTVIRVTVPR